MITESHLQAATEKIEKLDQEIFDDEKQISLLKENVLQNKKVRKIYFEGLERMKETVKKEDKKG